MKTFSSCRQISFPSFSGFSVESCSTTTLINRLVRIHVHCLRWPVTRIHILNLMATGFVVFGHGSSVESANDAVRTIAAAAAAAGKWVHWETAFLEAAPLLPVAVEKLLA